MQNLFELNLLERFRQGLMDQQLLRSLPLEEVAGLVELRPGCFDHLRFNKQTSSVTAPAGMWDTSPHFETVCAALRQTIIRHNLFGGARSLQSRKVELLVRMAADLAGRVLPPDPSYNQAAELEAAFAKLIFFLWIVDDPLDGHRRVFGSARSAEQVRTDMLRGGSDHYGHRFLASLTDLYMAALEGRSQQLDQLRIQASFDCTQMLQQHRNLMQNDSPEAVESARTELHRLYRGPENLLAETMADFARCFGPDFVLQGHFGRAMYDHFASRHLELDRGEYLELDEYRQIRRDAGAVQPCFFIRVQAALDEAQRHGKLTHDDFRSFMERYSKLIDLLEWHTNMQICFVNDLAGIVKDIEEAESMNCCHIEAKRIWRKRNGLRNGKVSMSNIDPEQLVTATARCIDHINHDMYSVSQMIGAMRRLDPVITEVFEQTAGDFMVGHLFFVWGEHAGWRYGSSFPLIDQILRECPRTSTPEDRLVRLLRQNSKAQSVVSTTELKISQPSLASGEFGGN